MGTYKYIAKTAAGEAVEGAIQADSEAAVLRSLDQLQLLPVEVSEQQVQKRMFRRGRVRAGDVGVVYAQLSDLLQAGVPLLRALDTLLAATPDPRLVEVLKIVRDDIAAGDTLAGAMGKHPRVFPSLHMAMVRAGERAGFLEDVLANLGGFIERQDELRGKVRGAMIYPTVICTLGVVIVTGILVILVPKFKPLLAKVEKPLPTEILFGLSDLLVSHIYLAMGLAVLAVVGIRALLRSSFGQRMWDGIRLRLPLFGGMVRMVSITRFCRILGTMLKNGVPIVEALEIAKDATGSDKLAASVAAAAEQVRAGEKLADPLRKSGFFPAEIIEMIAVAEEANQLEKVLLQIADTAERRTNRKVDQVVRLIEPLILVLLAVTIGFVAVGLLYPIFTMSQSLQS